MPDPLIQSFAPVSRADAHILVLGSMPGNVSLAASEYYAHPRNLFWDIVEEVFGISRRDTYNSRLQQLVRHRLALWDVAFECQRASSLDSDIVNTSVQANDFESFFAAHPQLQRICLNGNKAAELFRRHVDTTLVHDLKLDVIRLPSTSPANASIPREHKFNEWTEALLLQGN